MTTVFHYTAHIVAMPKTCSLMSFLTKTNSNVQQQEHMGLVTTPSIALGGNIWKTEELGIKPQSRSNRFVKKNQNEIS